MTNYYDVFNGDADGICALLQLRAAEPQSSKLVTGVKRDIALLERVVAVPGDEIAVLDISLDKNRAALNRVLDSGAQVLYVDHHFAGEIPQHPNLDAIINVSPEACTSILMNNRLRGRYVDWAIVGAFGDNLNKTAKKLASTTGIGDLEKLQRLGVLINYNGYGASVDDLHFPPDVLYCRLSRYSTPQDFLRADPETYRQLDGGYEEDMDRARNSKTLFEREHAAVMTLPDSRWARRVSGVYGNDLANQFPGRAHAVITERANAGYLVSVRAPLSNRVGADDICRQFPTGGGRKAAAGINDLPIEQLDQFVDTFQRYYQTRVNSTTPPISTLNGEPVESPPGSASV